METFFVSDVYFLLNMVRYITYNIFNDKWEKGMFVFMLCCCG